MSHTNRNEPLSSSTVQTKRYNSDTDIKKAFKNAGHRSVRRVALETEIPDGAGYKRLCNTRKFSDRISMLSKS